MALVRKDFSSWGDYLDWVVSTPGKSRFDSSAHTSGWMVNASKTSSFDEALQLARSGYDAGCRSIKRLSERLINKLSALTIKDEYYMDVYSPYGSYDMGAVISGSPENAYNSTQVMTEAHGTRCLKIAVSLSYSAYFKAVTLELRGAAIAAFIQLCEVSGIKCHIDVVLTTKGQGGYDDLESFINVKQANQPLDLALMAFQVIHPACLRRIGFRAIENTNTGGPSHGHTRSFPADGYDVVFQELSSVTYNDEFESAQSAEAFIRKLLVDQHVIEA